MSYDLKHTTWSLAFCHYATVHRGRYFHIIYDVTKFGRMVYPEDNKLDEISLGMIKPLFGVHCL